MAQEHNAATAQLDPNIQLTAQQQQLVDQVTQFIADHKHDAKHAVFVIEGGAGTGKSVVLSKLFYQIAQASADLKSPLFKAQNYFLVNHPELLKTYRQIAGNEPFLYKNRFQRPTSFINHMHQQNKTADVVVIDEAHLLISQPDPYYKFNQNNQLAEILKIAQITVIVFDPKQVLRTKSFWNWDRLNQIIKPYTVGYFKLTQQFRMHASDALIHWIDDFANGIVDPIPKDFGGYDFRIYDDCQKMYQDLLKRDDQYKLSRMLATLSYHHVENGVNYVIEDDLKIPWDTYNYSHLPYPEIPATKTEIGSMFTCQGFDLNYAGVIVGPSIKFDPKANRLIPDLDHYTYHASMTKRKDVTDPKTFDQIKTSLVLNDLNVLLKRGVHGLYLYIHDPILRKTLLNQINPTPYN